MNLIIEDPPYSDEEIARRRDEALLRALSTPHKLHSAMKIGKRKAKASPKAKIAADRPKWDSKKPA